MTQELSEVSQLMYHKFGDKTAVIFFEGFRSALVKFDRREVILFQIRSFPHSYAIEFLMAAFYLWEDFSAQDWLNLMRMNTPRIDPRKEVDPPADFVVGLNALEVYLSDAHVTDADKMHAKRYFTMYSFYLERDHYNDDECLDGVYFISEKRLMKAKKNLLNVFTDKWK